jgi:hypothetical protein
MRNGCNRGKYDGMPDRPALANQVGSDKSLPMTGREGMRCTKEKRE